MHCCGWVDELATRPWQSRFLTNSLETHLGRGRSMSTSNQRGSSAVEFALLLPLLISLLLGIIEFGNFFNQQISLTQAAREGARQYAINYDKFSLTELTAELQKTAPDLKLNTATTNQANKECTAGTTVILTLPSDYEPLTIWPEFVRPGKITGIGAMRCTG